ncbi:MAG TPA: methyltransferase [Ardenticatenaceae bacterium]|nr:methyltransferase [Ardenticatenaceae bacterium]
MKLGAIAQNVLERLVLAAGLIPTPLIDTHIAMLLARTVMSATKLGIFEALAEGPLTAGEVAARCDTHPAATGKLLDALVGVGYVQALGERYDLAPLARKWLLQASPRSLYPKMLLQFVEWEWIEHSDEFVRSGTPLQIHERLAPEEWAHYQQAMRSLALFAAPEVGWRTPVPRGAREMLDIGGAHGYFSVAICRRHPALRSVILDLPEAVAQAAPLLAREGMGDRIRYRAGNVLTDDLGSEAFDLVFMANVAHHFDAETNRALAERVARALRPGGVYVIQEAIRPRSAQEAGQFASLLDFYFAYTSESGAWSYEEMAAWQREAGLAPRKPIRFRLAMGAGQQVAVKVS